MFCSVRLSHCIHIDNCTVKCILVIYRSGKSKDKKKLMCYSGQFTLSMDRAQRGTDYKYVIVKKGVVHWEYLAEFRPRYHGGIVNRFLFIPEKYLKPGGEQAY